jgi:hypothetical protein
MIGVGWGCRCPWWCWWMLMVMMMIYFYFCFNPELTSGLGWGMQQQNRMLWMRCQNVTEWIWRKEASHPKLSQSYPLLPLLLPIPMQKNIGTIQYWWWFSNELGRKDEFCLNLCDVMSIYDDLPIFYTSCHYALHFRISFRFSQFIFINYLSMDGCLSINWCMYVWYNTIAFAIIFAFCHQLAIRAYCQLVENWMSLIESPVHKVRLSII